MIANGPKLGFKGEYKLVVNRPDGSVYETDWMKNIITDIGLDYIGNPTAVYGNDQAIPRYFRIGTGTSTPLATNTKLDNQIASSNGNSGYSTTTTRDGYTYTTTWPYTFPQGAVVGNCTEMGVGWESSNSGNSLWSRALILDSSGNPTTLTLTSIDQLTAYYRCSLVALTVDITGSFQIGSTTYNYTGRPYNLLNSTWISPIPNFNIWYVNQMLGGNANCSLVSKDASSPSYTDLLPVSQVQSVYINGSKYRDTTITVGINFGNFSVGSPPVIGIKTISFGNTGYWQYEFDQPIPKTNTQELTMTFRISWDRV